MKTLHRFWVTFIDPPQFSPLNLGCGVTAYDSADALELIERRVFDGKSMPEIESIVENADIRVLDINHVLPNIGSVTDRGIWFPLGH